jgi:hypothetical protein
VQAVSTAQAHFLETRVMLVVPLLNSSISILVLRGLCVSFVALNGNVSGIGTKMTIRLFLSKLIHLI